MALSTEGLNIKESFHSV